MASMLRKIFAPVALAAVAVGLVGCGETPQDAAAKPAIVQQMVENSASVCNTGPVHADKAQYAERLTKVLSGVTTAHLKTLESHKVTVCLDQRLENQDTGDFWHYDKAQGVYYSQKDGGIMTYRDNGMQPSEETFWHRNTSSDYGSQATGALARHIEKGEVPAPGGYLKAEIYGSKSHYAEWSTRTSTGALVRNPQLQQPPLKALSAKPGS